MYIYKVERFRHDTHTGRKEDSFESDQLGRERLYSSRVKALECIDCWIERYVERRNHTVVGDKGSKTFNDPSTNKYTVTLLDSKESREEYGFHTITEFIITKVEVY